MRVLPVDETLGEVARTFELVRRPAQRVAAARERGAFPRANPYAAPGGPDLDTVLAAIEAIFLRFAVAAAAITAYDPRVDDSSTIGAAACTIAAHIASHAARQR